MTTVAGLLCPLDPSDPVGLQMVSLGSQISGRSRGSDGTAALSDTAPGDEEMLNRIVKGRDIGCECRDMVSPSLQPGLAFEPTGTSRVRPPHVR